MENVISLVLDIILSLIIWLKGTLILESFHIFSLESIKTAQSLSCGNVAAQSREVGDAEWMSREATSNWVTLVKSLLTWASHSYLNLKGLG